MQIMLFDLLRQIPEQIFPMPILIGVIIVSIIWLFGAIKAGIQDYKINKDLCDIVLMITNIIAISLLPVLFWFA